MPLNQLISILSPDDVILDLGLTDVNYYEIERQINAASARIENFLDRPVKARDVVIRFDGQSGPLLDVGHITDVRSITFLSQRVGVPNTDVASTDFFFNPVAGTLYYTGGFPYGYQNIQVIARLGWDPVPDDIKEACLALIRFWRTTGLGASDLQSERIGDYSYTRFAPGQNDSAPDIPGEVQGMLEPYIRRAIV